jgi:PAS domain S-box-containing protein
VAILAVGAALALTAIPQIGRGLVGLLFLAVFVSAADGGIGPGLFATGLITLLAGFGPLLGESHIPPWRVVVILVLAAGGVFITLVVEALRAARSRAEGSEQWLTTVLTSIGDAVIATDAQGRVTFINPVARILTGWGAEAVGQPLEEIFRLVIEDTGAPVENPVERVLREGVLGLASHTVLIARDGTQRPIEASGAAAKDQERAITGIVLVFRDVTERRRSEDIQARLAAIVESSDDAILSRDLDGIITSWNAGAERLFGYSAEEAVGRSIGFLIPPDIQDEEPKIPARIRQGHRVDQSETRRRRKDGTVIDVSSTDSPIRDTQGAIIGASKIVRDITEKKRGEQQLKDEARRKDEFLAMLAHELRNPLASIRSAVEILEMPRAQNHIAWAKEVIARQVSHLAHLLDDLLDVSRITRGMIQVRRRLIDAESVINQAIESVRPLLDDRKHNLEVAVTSGPLRLEADPVRLEQVLVNLLTNAAKYTPAGGHIKLHAAQVGDQIIFTVSDNGMGISADVLPRLFDLFAQGERTLARSEGGLGVGLTIVKRLVELHEGSVSARSEGPGQGSEFTVRLPAVAEQPSAPPATGEPAPSMRGCRILIIEDNEDLARGLARLLKLLGHEVELAYDGPEGIEAARSYRPECIVLDIGLPTLDGYAVARALRQEEGFLGTMIIAISGYGQEEDRRRSQEAGMDHHLTKPVDIKTIAELIAHSV